MLIFWALAFINELGIIEMKTFLIITMLYCGLTAFSQSDYAPGQLYKIHGLTIDKSSQDTVPLILVEILNKGQRILATTSDFDGQFSFVLCSNKLPNDSLTLRTSGVAYYQETFNFNIISDTTFTLTITADPEKKMTKEKLFEYTRTFINECGTDEYNEAYENNNLYRHCDGRVKTFREIIDSNENLSEWEQINK